MLQTIESKSRVISLLRRDIPKKYILLPMPHSAIPRSIWGNSSKAGAGWARKKHRKLARGLKTYSNPKATILTRVTPRYSESSNRFPWRPTRILTADSSRKTAARELGDEKLRGITPRTRHSRRRVKETPTTIVDVTNKRTDNWMFPRKLKGIKMGGESKSTSCLCKRMAGESPWYTYKPHLNYPIWNQAHMTSVSFSIPGIAQLLIVSLPSGKLYSLVLKTAEA